MDFNQKYKGNSKFNAEKMLEMVNSERSKVGAGALKMDKDLMVMSEKHSTYQASIKQMTHNGPYGAQNPNDSNDSNGLAENVAYNTGSEEQVMISWINSQGHYKNMVNPKYNLFGCAEDDGYWTVRTPEKRNNAYDEDSKVVRYDGKVDELGGDEYAPTISRVD